MTPRIVASGEPEADELAAIVAALAALDAMQPRVPEPKPSRWRLAARDYEAEQA